MYTYIFTYIKMDDQLLLAEGVYKHRGVWPGRKLEERNIANVEPSPQMKDAPVWTVK